MVVRRSPKPLMGVRSSLPLLGINPVAVAAAGFLRGSVNKERGRLTVNQEEKLEKALQTLHEYVLSLGEQAGEEQEYGERLWQGIRQSEGLLQELAYYHDYGKFLCR